MTSRRHFATLEEIHRVALTNLDDVIVDYLEGGAGDETTIRRNRSAFEEWEFQPRVMSGLSSPSTATTFLGLPLSVPILTAPFGSDTMFHEDGQKAVARANQAMGTVSMVPEAGSFSYERVAAAAPAAARIAQLHPAGSEENFVRLLTRISAAGYSAVCVTVDSPTGGWRERNRRNALEFDSAIIGGNYNPADREQMEAALGQLFTHVDHVWSWRKLSSLLEDFELPWIAKGITTVSDARAAVDAGASAIIVSNHGGRQLDDVPASLPALVEIRSELGTQVDIALDSGIRRGSDIIKAVALGATAVVLGRSAVYGLTADGQRGVERTIELLTEEMITVLTLLGRGGITDLTHEAIRRVPR